MRFFLCQLGRGAAINADVIGCRLLTGRGGDPKKLSFFGPLSPRAIPPEPFILSEWVCGEWGSLPPFLGKEPSLLLLFPRCCHHPSRLLSTLVSAQWKVLWGAKRDPPPLHPPSPLSSHVRLLSRPFLSTHPFEMGSLGKKPSCAQPPPLCGPSAALSRHWATDPVTSPCLHASAGESASERRRRTAAARAWGGRCVPRRTVETQQQQSEAPLHGRGMAFTRSVSLKPF